MRNVTLSAEDHLIEHAREQAHASQTMLTQLFREWLARLAADQGTDPPNRARFARSAAVNAGGKFSHYKLNAR